MSSGDHDRLRAPGIPAQPSERDQAVGVARRILENHQPNDAVAMLARQFLRALGLS